MSLPSIAFVILFERCGPFKSLFRRCLFAGLSYLVVFFPHFFGFEWLRWAFTLWVVLFLMVDDIQMTYEEGKQECERQRQRGPKCKGRCKCIEKCKHTCTKPQWIEGLISCLTIPLRIPFNWAPNVFESGFEGGRKKLKRKTDGATNCIIECLLELLYNFLNVFQGLCIFVAIIVSLIAYVVAVVCCLLKFVIVDLILPFICPHQPDIKVPLRLVTFVIFVFLIGMTFIFILTVVTSLTLNAEFFNPFVAPILTLIIYFWKNWKSSVEAKCLDLKTLIIDVSLQKVKAKKNEQNSGEDRAKATNSKAPRDKIRILKFLCPCLSCIEPPEIKEEVIELKKLSRPAASNGEKENIIKFDKHGEAMISKATYETIRQEVLRRDLELFYFFRRVLFVGLYAFGMLTVMILARESGVSGIIQIISAIFAGIIPFIFDTMFGPQHFSQISITCKEMAMRQKLEHILNVKEQENNTILIELVNENDESATPPQWRTCKCNFF